MNSLKSRIIGGTITILAVGLLAVIPALAQTGVDNTAAVNASAASLATSSATTTRGVIKGFNQAQRLAALGARGVKEVDVRVTSLNTLITRVQGLRNVSDAEKSSIVTTLQGLIVNLNSLKDQITTTDSSSTTLRDDIQSITENYRIYALAIPQLNIFAAADRITTVLAMLNTVGGKLQTRLAGSSGVPNMTVLQADLTDFAAKISDANTQVQAAVSEVSPLTPDQGDKTKMASNTATLKDARSKIQAAQKDLVAARKYAQTIITALIKSDKAIMGKTGAAATTTTGTGTGTTTP